MPVIIGLKSGNKFTLDRKYSISDVRFMINDGRNREDRQSSELIGFDDNQTPSRTFYIDPNEVESIRHDGRNY